MGKEAKKYCIVILILAVIYNVLVFAIPYPHKSNLVFWMSWAGGMLAIAVQPIIAYFGLKDSETLKSKIYGWPIIRNGYIYLGIQLAITVLFLIVGAFVVIPGWILPIIIVILIGFTVIGMFVADTYREEIEKMDAVAPISVKFINDLKVDSNMLSQRKTSEDIHRKLVEFAEEVKYSDPVSSESLAEIEDEINRKYIVMKDNVINNKRDGIIDEIDELLQLLNERNQRAKLAKKKYEAR